mmetsp:Transcript_14652/g.31963  ORF Transcript_14652/g.31963 Transcript_14652/m.31963 type:complete len:435 (+) Transcript_14652:119-1423(+)
MRWLGLRERVSSNGDEEGKALLRSNSTNIGSGGGGDNDDNDDKKLLKKTTNGSSTVVAVASSFPRRQNLYQEVRIRWNLFSSSAKIAIVIVVTLIVWHLLVGFLDVIYQYNNNNNNNHYNNKLHPTTTTARHETSFAVVINTYKRPDMLKDAVRHYGETCGRRMGVAQVFIVWADLKATPPAPQSLFQDSSSSSSSFLRLAAPSSGRSTVEILRVAKDSLNSRFLPIQNLQSQAVFMVDDDVRVDCRSLYRGFEAWKANPQSMVGYYPRLAAATNDRQHYVYQAWPIVWWRQSMNFVLTKASFFHSRYLALYSNPAVHPSEILDYVDQRMNCEDVAMALIVANQTTDPMIYVEGSVSDKGLFNGISTRTSGAEHMDARSKCLDDLTQIYQKRGWGRPLDRAVSLRRASWIQHATTWQFRPSNIFEWGALENIFK